MIKEATYEPLVRRRRRRHQSWIRRVTRRPRHFVRDHKALSILIGIALLLLIALLIWLWILNNKLNDVPRFDLEIEGRPPDLAGTNILLVGVDDGKGRSLEQMLEGEEWTGGVFRSDAMLLAHIDENFTSAQVFSIPRDSYVRIPENEYCSAPCRSKLNAAFSWGGPELLAQSVENLTNTYLDHVVIADFEGFKDITETLDGVTVYIPEEAANPGGLDFLNAGWQRIQGEEALFYVRSRYQLPRGDFDRVQRQQNVLRSIFDDVTSFGTLANPVKLTQLVDDLASNVAVDSGFTNGKLRNFAFDSRNLGANSISFGTIPHHGSKTIDGAGSVVLVEPEEVRALFKAVQSGNFGRYLQNHPDQFDTLPGAAQVY
jgi:LCP family protein required for cell wall assembly